MMSCAGNSTLQTPAMDRLAKKGIRFERAYCSNPVCIPSRFSLMTGRMPSEIGQKSNAVAKEVSGEISNYIKETGLGYLMKEAGYDAVYGGKEHLPKLRATDLGFDYICENERGQLADFASEYIQQKHDSPYCFVVSLINPHDICYMAIMEYAKTLDLENITYENSAPEEFWTKCIMENSQQEVMCVEEALQRPKGISKEEFFEKHCPPLPPNFEVQDDEPDAIWAIKEQRKFKQYAHDHFTEEQWRMHRWAYCRLIEKVDAKIAKVLDAVEKSGDADNTVVVFTSDHGDMDSAHRMEHKTALYEEACNVPLIIVQPNMPERGIQSQALVSNGLDLVPTLCDYAGIAPPETLKGKSLRPLIEQTETALREHVYVESEFGKMIVSDRYKYARYDEGKNREQLYDLKLDPYETKNFATSAGHQGVLCSLRKEYEKTSMKFETR